MPRPLARAPTTPETSAKPAINPVIMSTTDKPNRAGGPSGSPVTLRYPASACIR
jgi:hypothetical protein